MSVVLINRERFLRSTPVVDWDHPAVQTAARDLAHDRMSATDVARASFEWVRDEIRHTSDHKLDVVTCAASEVLQERSGFCYAKSHLLAALLRANGIPAGFVYQRVALDAQGSAFCLHGLNAIWLNETGWYRADARGRRDDLRAEFAPPREVLPFAVTAPGEQIFGFILEEPLPLVVSALRQYRTRDQLEAHLPDASALFT